MTFALVVLGILVVVLGVWRLLPKPEDAAQAEAFPPGEDPLAPLREEASREMREVLDEPSPGGEGRPVRASQLASLGDLAAGIAHEINNPVAIMVEEAGWIEDLLEELKIEDPGTLEEVRRALGEIKTQGRRCKDITHNLLSFARKTSNRPERIQLNDLVRDVVRASKKRLGEDKVVLETRLDDELPLTWVSPSEMQQVLVNLVNNAIDALGEQGGRIGVGTRLDGGDLVVSVSDTGHGIPQDKLERIFDPFYTTKPVGKGTGLGLSICYGIVEKLGGDISVSSEVGAGTRFEVRLPHRSSAEDAGRLQAAAPGSAPDENGGPRASQKPTVVLVVDDEAAFVEALRKRLSKRGLEILAAASGQEALDQVRRHRKIDVVLLDVKMSGGDGIETLREIKKARPLLEVLLLSSHTTVESAIEGMKLGAFDYLLKPCEVGQLLAQIQKARAKKERQEQRIVEARIKEITLRRV